jgi:prolyl-tRNA editing enzyme YbaK/EbsC (Cys-tRNA(Pro) deacylase)
MNSTSDAHGGRCMLRRVASVPLAAAPVVAAAARRGIELDVRVFGESTHTAAEAAAAVGAQIGQIVKSLVFVAPAYDGTLEAILVLASGANQVDVGQLAAVTGEPHVRRASADEARALTGFAIGGIPPFGHARPLRTIMDTDLGRFPIVWAAAGTPNAVFQIAPATLRLLTEAVVAPIAAAGPPPNLAPRGAPASS